MRKIKQNIKQWIKAFILALLSVLFIKTFFFWIYFVPSISMEKTLLPGDVILVNKMSYGIRFPITLLTFPLSHQKMPFNDKMPSYSDFIQIPYFRMFTDDVQRNDIVVFNYPLEKEYPVDHRSFYIKRCVGLPGDSLLINNKKVFINGKDIGFPKWVSFNYYVESTQPLTQDTLKKYNITEGGRITGKNQWQLTLSESSIKLLEKNTYIKRITPLDIKKNNYADYIFPFNKNYPWNIDYFGPVLIPKKGMKLMLNSTNISLYQRIIEVYEDNKLALKQNQIFINGKIVHDYTFKMDYYFVLGDNRHNSSDSRFWGFVPENHIIGKAVKVLFSTHKNKLSNSRILMPIE